MSPRGRIKVYLGFAPGVGKTYAMLQEAHELHKQGHAVIVGSVEPHGRKRTAELVNGLPVLPHSVKSSSPDEEKHIDIAAILAKHPQTVLVDELAHTYVGTESSTNTSLNNSSANRWQEVYTLLENGINVVSTLNIQHLESLNDVVAAVTGIRQTETIPDQVLRDADEIELVDLSPDTLRIRLSRGDIYDAEHTTDALSNYFRLGNLTALRELSLLWLADKVDEGIEKYRAEQKINDSWPARERIVVAVNGTPASETIIRRGARIAGRKADRDFIVVYVARDNSSRPQVQKSITKLQELTESLEGEWRVIMGSDVAETIIEFAKSINASQVVIGVSRDHTLFSSNRVSRRIIDNAGSIDVHIVSSRITSGWQKTVKVWKRATLGMERKIMAWLVAVLAPPALTSMMLWLNVTPTYLAPVLLGYLTLVVITALLGGILPALLAVFSGSLLANWYFTVPLHTLTLQDPSSLVALLLFLAIAISVAWVVNLAEYRAHEAKRIEAKSIILSDLASGVIREGDDLPRLLRRLQETFGLETVELQRYSSSRRLWYPLATSLGQGVMLRPEDHPNIHKPVTNEEKKDKDGIRIPIGEKLCLIIKGRRLNPEEISLLEAHGARITAMLNREDFDAMRRATAALEVNNRVGSALLTSVSHDLRTPLASIKAAVKSLTENAGELDEITHQQLIDMIGKSTDEIDKVVGNLLDMSQINSHTITVTHASVDLANTIETAIEKVKDAKQYVETNIPADLPLVSGDEKLVERILINLLTNARIYAPNSPIIVNAGIVQDLIEVRVIDYGPGIREEDKKDVFTPFTRFADANTPGLGLGLAVASGFAEEMGGSLTVEDSPGGGTTFVLSLLSAKSTKNITPAGRKLSNATTGSLKVVTAEDIKLYYSDSLIEEDSKDDDQVTSSLEREPLKDPVVTTTIPAVTETSETSSEENEPTSGPIITPITLPKKDNK